MFSSDHLISMDSCKRARLERQIRAEERRILRLQEKLQVSENPNLRRKWLEARNRLRDLRLELMRTPSSIF